MTNTRTNRRYIIKSKVRFTIFIAIIIFMFTISLGLAFGLGVVNGDSMDSFRSITLESGDTLWDIAKANAPAGEDPREVVYDICQLNNITASNVEAGDTILVPVYGE